MSGRTQDIASRRRRKSHLHRANPNSSTLLQTGCLESLVYYNTLLLGLISDPTESERLRQMSFEHLATLRRVDPLRRKRYADLEQNLVNRV